VAVARQSVTAPTVAGPKTAVEGTRFALGARVPAATRARTVTLQFKNRKDYDFESTTSWTKLLSTKVRGRSRITLHVLADDAREAWFRVVVTYVDHSVRRSTATRVNYLHWFPLSSFSSYYRAGSAIDVLSFEMAGRSWRGWFSNGTSGESRYTLGRACIRLRATFGLVDSSSDGATGKVTLATIEPGGSATTLYASPSLVAGKTTSINRALARPYRFSIVGQDTTPPAAPGATQPIARAAVGDPQFLCHFD
jgi:hypothetical protein